MKIYCTNVGMQKFAIKKVLEIALKHLGQPSAQLEMSLSVVSQEEIKQLNNRYRNVDAVTDVLSFPTFDAGRKAIDIQNCSDVDPETGKINLGDIIICLDRAKQQAEEYGHSLKREMCFLTLHGLLHLLGYDHMNESDEAQMVQLQKEILQKANVNR